MRMFLMVLFLSASTCLAQEIPPGPLQPATEPTEQGPAGQTQDTFTVPEGTHVQLALANPLRTSTARAGDTVRAVTTFPVTVDKDLAIPQGSYVEGSIVKVGKHGSARFDSLLIRFEQIVFANGYHVALDGSIVDARAMEPSTNPTVSAGTPAVPVANGFQQQPPQPPPLPQVGPSRALVIGVGTAAMVGVMATVAYLAHRHARDQGRDFDTGFQFEIVLQAPLMLDRARVTAAVSGASAR
ncbi:MAG TPA: hypothetical protein VJO16_00175 [Candidatus Acidoferrum sp.]|nr:hypothetical protein [Candidatus Acidoferrum sp.]